MKAVDKSVMHRHRMVFLNMGHAAFIICQLQCKNLKNMIMTRANLDQSCVQCFLSLSSVRKFLFTKRKRCTFKMLQMSIQTKKI